MKIAPYYQNLLEQALQAAQSLEPITFAGMFDSGVDYLFNLSVPLFSTELPSEIIPIFIDLSGLTTAEQMIEELSFFTTRTLATPRSATYLDLTSAVEKILSRRKLVYVLYFGQEGVIDDGLIVFLNRLRNLLGWRFSYVSFLSTRVLFRPPANRLIFQKVFKRNLVTVLPLFEADTRIVLSNYVERYAKKVTREMEKQIFALSGGNPGLIKALYLQAIASQNQTLHQVDLLDERIHFRLSGIVNDLPSQYIEAMRKKQKVKVSADTHSQLLRYGYVTQVGSKNVPFTALLPEFIRTYMQLAPRVGSSEPTNSLLLHLTKSQRKVLIFLEGHQKQLVTKDDLAKVLWEEDWADKYSDWAIDQLIYTLRERLNSLKHPGKIITKKGEGIIFLPEKQRI